MIEENGVAEADDSLLPPYNKQPGNSNGRLTTEQLAVVHHEHGHARVSAVAGSGKTTTMVARIGKLLADGVPADRILILMFNRSAREGFETQLTGSLRGSGLRLPEVRTFHSLGLRLVNSFVRRGALPDYRLVTEDYRIEKLAREVANHCKRQADPGADWLTPDELADFISYIDLVKGCTSSPAEVFETIDAGPGCAYFKEAYAFFEESRCKHRLRTYSDLIYEPLQALAGDGELVAWVTNRIDHIIVDEYQDINDAQQQLLRVLAGERAQVMVVGDVDQCIYVWRGARPDYITSRFSRDFPGGRDYTLSTTFRYGHRLSLAANFLIGNNRQRDRKLCISHTATPQTELFCVEEEGGRKLAEELLAWLDSGRRLSEVAVLVRLFAQSVVVELALLEAGIPYRIEGAVGVFGSQEILALIGYLHLAAGSLALQADDERQILIAAMLGNPHPGLPREDLADLARSCAADVANAPQLIAGAGHDKLSPFLRRKLVDTAENWSWVARKNHNLNDAATLLSNIIDRVELYEFYRSLSARAATAENRVQSCMAFVDFARSQGLTVDGLLGKWRELQQCGHNGYEENFENQENSEIGDGPESSELTAGERGRRQPGYNSKETLLITSIHRAKGLEWPLVLLPGLEEGSFPFYREQMNSGVELEDERRLFYVAITRGRERVVCFHPGDPTLAGCRQHYSSRAPQGLLKASRFLYETNVDYCAILGTALDGVAERELETSFPPTDKPALTREYLQRIERTDLLTAVREMTVDEGLGEAGRSGTSGLSARSGRERHNGTDGAFASAASAAGTTASSGALTMKDLGDGMRVLHPMLGAGTVTAIKDRRQGRLAVNFDEHGEVILLAAYARLQAIP